MTGICPESLEADPSDHSVAADVLVRQDPDEEEEEEEGERDDKNDADDDDEEDEGGYSERASPCLGQWMNSVHRRVAQIE